MATPQPTPAMNPSTHPTTPQAFNWEGIPLRTFKDAKGVSWFIAKDVCDVLDFRDAHNATRGLDEDEKGTHIVSTLGGVQSVTVINESGLYSLILRSRKPEAKVFRRWVTHTVLPAIRSDGAYVKGEERLLESASFEELQAQILEVQARAALAVDLKLRRTAAHIEEREARAVALKALSRGRPARKCRKVVIPAGEV